ncbi:hypothetical protein ACKWTF_001979 [Chironomus riparius]
MIKYLFLWLSLISVINMSNANRIETADSYIKQLEKSSNDEEAERLIKNVLEILSPIAKSDPNFNNLRIAAYKIIEPEELREIESHRNSGCGVANGKRRRINFSAFIEVFQIFKLSFKYENLTDYDLKSEEL